MVWGLIWYPFRMLKQAGIPGDVSTLLTYALAMVLGVFGLRRMWRELPNFGWWAFALTLSAGWANFGYVLATLQGEVMRVLLLFYLAPLWTILFSYWLLGERLNRHGYGVIALSLAGAFVMLWKPRHGIPVPQNTAEWIGLSAGMCFALTNVLARRVQELSVELKSYCVWAGTVALAVFPLLLQGGLIGQLQALSLSSWMLLAMVSVVLYATTLAVQYGITNMPANRAIVLFLSELVFAAVSSYLLAGEEMELKEYIGAILLVSASLLSGKLHPSH